MTILKFERYTFHVKPMQLREGTRLVELEQEQLDILAILLRAAGKVVAKEVLLTKTQTDSTAHTGLVKMISGLKRALGRTEAGGEFIAAVKGAGYRLAQGVLVTRCDQAGRRALEANQEANQDANQKANQDANQKTNQEVAVPTFRAEQFQLLVNAIEDYAIYMLDCSGRVMTWNPGAEKNKGYKSSEILGQHYSIFFLPEDIEAGVPDRTLAVAGKEGRALGEGWRVRRNGERFWASYVLTSVKSESGSIVGYAKVVRDLTERKRQEDALLRAEATVRRERDRLRAAAESSLDAFYICEAVRGQNDEIEDFLFTYLNANVAKMVSVPLVKLLGGKMCELLPANLTLGLFEAYKRVVLTGEAYIAEFPVQAEDVISQWIHVQAVSLGDGIAITASDITKRKNLEQQTLHLAQHDALTGVLNRNLVPERIAHAIERARPHNGCVGICLVDIDNFKKINDSFGHQNGDIVLTTVATRIAASLRAVDSIFRIGGDEFLVVLPDVSSESDVALCAKRMLAVIQRPIVLCSKQIQITCSIGISTYPKTAHEIDDLLSTADSAMYAVKRKGKNGFQSTVRS